MSDRVKSFWKEPYFRFLFAGGVAALLNILSRAILSIALNYTLSIIIAHLIGMTVAYLLMKAIAFDDSGRNFTSEYIRFGVVNIFTLCQIWVVSVGLADFIFPQLGIERHAELIAHVIGVFLPAITSYFLHKHFTFAKA